MLRRRDTLWRLAAAGAAVVVNLAAPAAEEYAAPAGAPTADIQVDAREAPRGIMSAHLTLPVASGPLTLVYPKWLPGYHSPAGPLTSLAGPIFKANGQTLPWRRDSVDLNAFHLEIPAGVTQLGVDLEIDTSIAPDGLVQGLEAPRTATESLLILEWNQLLLYPAATRSDGLSYQASVRLPAGWKYATALGTVSAGSDGIRFAPVSLTTLVDSTLIAGRYMRDIALGGTPAVTLHIAADTPVALGYERGHGIALSAAGPRGCGPVRRHALRSLRVSLVAHRPDHAGWSGTSSVERQSFAAARAPRRSHPPSGGESPGARVRPFVEREDIDGRRDSPPRIIRIPCSATCSGCTRD